MINNYIIKLYCYFTVTLIVAFTPLSAITYTVHVPLALAVITPVLEMVTTFALLVLYFSVLIR